jgi:phosphoserine phosphatase
MDVDSTLIAIECIDEIADLAGRKAEVAAITASAMGRISISAKVWSIGSPVCGPAEKSLPHL